jgi:ABC-type lipoprotein export system ATPase subunit
MKINSKGEGYINQILESIDGIERAEAPSFFYTRLLSKLNKEKDSSIFEKYLSVLMQPSLLIASLSIFIIVNLFAIYSMKKEINVASNYHNNQSDTTFQAFVQEYDLSISTIYSESKNEE